MTNSDSDSPSSSAQKRPSRKKRNTKSITIIDGNIALKPKHGKKPDPGAPKITRPCTECGKKFWSWKALFGHMRCHPERQWRGINPPPNFRPQYEKQVLMTEEDHEVAACLLLLANGTTSDEAEDLNTRFECSSCNKVFGSHQALGGHRASHKNVKGCFAITRSDWEGSVVEDHIHNCASGDDQRDDSKMVMVLGGHTCGICLRVFPSGQALGGHKRCHWEKGENETSITQGLSPFAAPREGCGVDLNLPAPLEHDCASSALTLDLRLGL